MPKSRQALQADRKLSRQTLVQALHEADQFPLHLRLAALLRDCGYNEDDMIELCRSPELSGVPGSLLNKVCNSLRDLARGGQTPARLLTLSRKL